jgi:hypothetical protein
MMARETPALSLPLFDASSPTTAALEDPNSAAFGAVVSTDGSSFWLHKMEDLAKAKGVHPVTFAHVKGHRLAPLTEEVARKAGLNRLKPSDDQVNLVCRALNADEVVASVAKSLAGDRMALLLATKASTLRVAVRTKYVCSQYHEKYDESVYVANNGQCPKHQGATLSPEP